jgi:dienelactone hydrolase
MLIRYQPPVRQDAAFGSDIYKDARNMNASANASHAKLDPEHVAIIEPVRGSDMPVHLMYVETIDGLYTPIGLRTPNSGGPFPLVLFAAGNGGGGMSVVRDFTQNRSWTQEQFLAAGYAVAWMRYRAEVDYAYDRIGKLIEDRRQRRQLLNRGPLEYEDVIAIIEHVKTLPTIDPDRIGYLGMSHGGEMAFKIAAEYAGVRAMVANEPASHEFLRLKPDATAQIDPATGLLNVEKMLMREPEKVRALSARRSWSRAAMAMSCREFSVSATICSRKPARRRGGRPTIMTNMDSSMSAAMTTASTIPIRSRSRR